MSWIRWIWASKSRANWRNVLSICQTLFIVFQNIGFDCSFELTERWKGLVGVSRDRHQVLIHGGQLSVGKTNESPRIRRKRDDEVRIDMWM